MFWILILSLLGLSITAAYRGINLMSWTLGMALILAGFAVFTSVSMTAIVVLSVLFAAIAVPLNVMALPSSSVYVVPAFAVGGTLLTVTVAVTMELTPPSSSRTRSAIHGVIRGQD